MFSNLKRMVEKNRFSSIIFLIPENYEVKFERTDDNYNVILIEPSKFEEYKISENDFFKYLEKILKDICFGNKFKITNTIKMNTVCSFRVEYNI